LFERHKGVEKNLTIEKQEVKRYEDKTAEEI
jgi:hypothetical protein